MLWLLAAGPAFAQEAPAVQAVIDQAQVAELPLAPLQAKAREGAAKGVPPARVAGVLSTMVEEWRTAEAILGDRARAADRAEVIPAAASALRNGAPEASVRTLAGSDHATPALQALADVLYAGLTPPQADQIVAAAMATSEPQSALVELPQATRLLLATSSATSAVANLTGAMSQGTTPLAAVPSDKGGPPSHSNVGGNDKGKGKGKTK